MTENELSRLARKAGMSWDQKYHWYVSTDTLRKFASLVSRATLDDNDHLRRQVEDFKERWRRS